MRLSFSLLLLLLLPAGCAPTEDAAQASFPGPVGVSTSQVDAWLGEVGLLPTVGRQTHVAVRDRPFECLVAGSEGQGGQVAVGVGACADSNAQQFVFAADGTIHVGAADGPCLRGEADGDVAAGTCDNGAEQRWGAGGAFLQNAAHATCLTRHGGEAAQTALALADCRADDGNQTWTYGSMASLAAETNITQAPFPQATTAFAGTSAQALLGYPALAAPPPTGSPVRLVLRQGLDSCVDGAAVAGNAEAVLRRCENSNSWVFLADGSIQTGWSVHGSLPMCLGATSIDGNGRAAAVLSPCTARAEQRWTAIGHNLRHMSTGLCLAMDPLRPGIGAMRAGTQTELSLLACDGNAVAQSWAYGPLADLRLAAKVAQQDLSVAELCRQPVQVVLQLPAELDDETAWLLNHFGGDAAHMQAAVAESIAVDCNVIWYRGRDVMPLPPTIVTFLPDDANITAVSNWVAGPMVNFNVSPAKSNWARRAEADSYPDYVLHHELAHIWDRRGLPYKRSLGLIEGYADMVAYRTGFKRPNAPQFKGGSFANGYADAMWFLLYLDMSRYPAPAGQRFTDLIQREAWTQPADPNWFADWTLQQTGKTVDSLWDDYQHSF